MAGSNIASAKKRRSAPARPSVRLLPASSANEAAEILKNGAEPFFAPKKKTNDGCDASLRRKAASEAAGLLCSGRFDSLSLLKGEISSKHGMPYLRNSEILPFIPKNFPKIRSLLLKSPTRTLSGVSPIALMPCPAPCGGACIYCPKGENAPQSYTGFEPTTMRAIQCGYSARKQILARIRQYRSQGHPTDKCHLIVMGGNFLNVPVIERHEFMKRAFDTLNGFSSKTIRHSVDENEFAPHKAIGVTFESRPDYCFEQGVDELLSMGGTQIELGVQALSDRVYKIVRRGHTVEDVIRSTRILRNAGFKICYHMMPGLFSTPKQDIGYFRTLFSDPRFRPDMLKIYPALVLRNTGLYRMWKQGKYVPYTTEQAAEVISSAVKMVPPYVRISRVQRDIPVPLVAAGVMHSNLRQMVKKRLDEQGERCRCIRCREIGGEEREKRGSASAGTLKLEIARTDYSAGAGKEIFLSFEDKEKDLIAGFIRLRIPSESHREEIGGGTALIRELHVYGQEASIGEYNPLKSQHKGLGAQLLSNAEKAAKKEFGLGKISVLSGPGARGYYRKHGYSLDGPYMSRKI